MCMMLWCVCGCRRVRPESKLERPVLPALPAVPLRKLLFSATVTANPQKLALLDLRYYHLPPTTYHVPTTSQPGGSSQADRQSCELILMIALPAWLPPAPL